MRRPVFFSALLFTLSTFSNLSFAQNNATTTVSANPSTITVGGTVELSATVQPDAGSSTGKTIARPTGTITFLDGSAPLSTPIPLAPNSYSSATFPQIFGTPDPTLNVQQFASSIEGELTGDLNGDGVPDLLIYGYVSSQYSFQTFTSKGKAGYNVSAVQTFAFPAFAHYPSVTNIPQLLDLNGDGRLDLLCGLLVAYGNGDGTFAAPTPVSFLSSGFVTSYAADLNGDGKTDILAVVTIPGSGLLSGPVQFEVMVFLNQGAGSFTSAGTFPVTTPYSNNAGFSVNFFAPTFVDLNGDGKLDLITQTQTVGATQVGADPLVTALLNNGNGTFGSPIPASIPDPPDDPDNSLAFGASSGDVNGDGKQDLILTLADDAGNANAITLLGNGDGTFQNPLYLTLQMFSTPFAQIMATPGVVVQDFNLDSKQDLIFGNGQFALGNGDGTFVLSTPLFPLQLSANWPFDISAPLVQVMFPGSLEPSVVYLLPAATPPAASIFTPQASSAATFNTSSLTVGAHTITAKYSGDANYAADTSVGIAVTVSQAASTVAAAASANPSFAGQSVTFTAKVTGAGPTPTGNVTFASGSTTLGSAALSGGSASYTTSSLTTAGTQTITVSYAGDVNTQASSTTLSQTVDTAFNMAPDGSGSNTLTVKAGQTVSAPINVTGAAGFSGTVTFACSGLPTNATCSFSPATINVSGTVAVPTLLSVNTAATATTGQLRPGFGGYGLAFAGLLLFWPARRSRHRVWAILLYAVAFGALGLIGCSSGSGAPPLAQTTAGSYNFTVTASSGGLQAQTAYTLVVQ